MFGPTRTKTHLLPIIAEQNRLKRHLLNLLLTPFAVQGDSPGPGTKEITADIVGITIWGRGMGLDKGPLNGVTVDSRPNVTT